MPINMVSYTPVGGKIGFSGGTANAGNGSASCANNTAVNNLLNSMAIKMQFDATPIFHITGDNVWSLFQIDQDGAGTNIKYRATITQINANTMSLDHRVPTQGGGTTGNFITNIIPSTGSQLCVYMEYTHLPDSQKSVIFDTHGTILIASSGTQNLGPLPNSGSIITLNFTNNGGARSASYSHFAIYSTPLTGSAMWSKPHPRDHGLVAMWDFNDNFSGSSPSFAVSQFGGTNMVFGGPATNAYQWAYSGSSGNGI